uniref:Uncharacterized protein n=1 Tax=viral metagenome TaxID=1070528 RepID=A0A6M3MF53_9ZZZZ
MSKPEKSENLRSLIDWMGYLNAVDSQENARVTIAFQHHEVHEGNHYTVAVVDTDVDIAGPKYVRLTAPDTAKRIHFMGVVSADGASLAELYEDPTILAGGTALAENNNNRNSVNVATATAFEDTTIQAPNNDGTLLFAGRIGGTGVSRTRFAGNMADREEWILKQGEDYLVKVTVDADNTEVAIVLTWYEV